MPEVVFHYTTRQGAQEIVIARKVKPGASGKVYVTEDTYPFGVTATARLAIPNKIAETVLVIAVSGVTGLRAARSVGPILAADGTELRPGGGTERWTDVAIDVVPPVTWQLSWP